MLETAAASGTLVASAMEAAGYHYQAYLLDTLTEPFTASLGSLFYVIAIITALINFAAFGQYKLTRWLIFGPIVFVAVISSRTEAITPRWKFAGMAQEKVNESATQQYQAAVTSAVDGIEVNREGYANVSSLYAGYNSLISSIVQELTRVIAHVRQDERLNAKFLIRPQLHGQLTNSSSHDPLFNELMHNFFYQCSDALQAAIGVNNILGGPAHADEHEATLRSAMNESVESLQPNSLLYLAGLKADYGEWWKGVESEQRLRDAMASVGAPHVYQGNEREVAVNTALTEIRNEMPSFTCGKLWNIVYFGLHIEADRRIKEVEQSVAGSGMSGEELYAELNKVEGISKAAGTNDFFSEALAIDKLRQVVARNMLNNHMQGMSTLYPTFLSRLAAAGDGVDGATTQGIRDIKDNYRHVRRAEEWRKKSEAFTHAENLPYYQGVMLFFLSICFPFFSLLLLIPGRYTAFMHWFYLWMWVKSWDVGFAIVMSLDDLLFELLVAVHEKTATTPKVIFSAELDNALRALEAVDPTFGPTIYYTIIGTALAAIPTVTSQMVLGMAAAGSQMIASGMALQADKTGDASGMSDTQTGIMNARGGQGDAVMQGAKEAMSSLRSGQGSPQSHELWGKLSDPAKAAVEGVWNKAIDAVVGQTIDSKDGVMQEAEFVKQGLKGFSATTGKTAKELLSAGVHGGDQEIRRLAFLTGLQSAAGEGSKVAQDLLGQIAKTAYDFRSKEASAAMHLAHAMALNTPAALERASQGALVGALPLPWQVDSTVFDEQYALNALSMFSQMEVLEKSAEAMSRLTKIK